MKQELTFKEFQAYSKAHGFENITDFLMLCKSLDKIVIAPMLSDANISDTTRDFGQIGVSVLMRWHLKVNGGP